MAAIVLESWIGSQYEDSPSSYEFPAQYLRYFEAKSRGEPLYAVIYEPRGDQSRGRMKYVAWAEIATTPYLTGRRTAAGRPLYAVDYVEGAQPFDAPVPRELLGEPIETWLQLIPRGRPRNVATFGRAVRPLISSDFERILQLGGAAILESKTFLVGIPEISVAAERERVERLVSLLRRNVAFRRDVISAYDRRCAVSGFGLAHVPLSKAAGLIDAAHIRPVAFDGPDAVTNGLPLTPTLHRLFDAGLFTLRYREGHLETVASPRLEPAMIQSPDNKSRLVLHTGLQIGVPENQRMMPSQDQIRFHQEHVFQGGQSDIAG